MILGEIHELEEIYIPDPEVDPETIIAKMEEAGKQAEYLEKTQLKQAHPDSAFNLNAPIINTDDSK